jgi:3'(2'), 5'-bisphosphate nucleotidase/myo-inositol-1(or 4)-monophosphatase
MIEVLAGVVRAAGERLLALRGSAHTRGHWEGSQLKTPADLLMHRFLVEHLAPLVPDLPVISEEDAPSHAAGRPPEYWLIDPIDGTASFSGGFSGFVTQVALMRAGRPVLAAIVAPALDLHYCAVAGGGARLNGRALRVEPAGAGRILIDNHPAPRGTARALFDALDCTGYVESGSIALKICRVADGTADLFFKDVVVRDWDVAPAHLLLEEAGGVISGLQREPFVYAGNFDKPGLLAASSAALADAAAAACIAPARAAP